MSKQVFQLTRNKRGITFNRVKRVKGACTKKPKYGKRKGSKKRKGSRKRSTKSK